MFLSLYPKWASCGFPLMELYTESTRHTVLIVKEQLRVLQPHAVIAPMIMEMCA